MRITRICSVVVLEVLLSPMDFDALSTCSESHKNRKEKVKECEC